MSDLQQNGCSPFFARNVNIHKTRHFTLKTWQSAGSSRPAGGKDSKWEKHKGRDHARSINSCFFTILQPSFWKGCAAGHSRRILQVLHWNPEFPLPVPSGCCIRAKWLFSFSPAAHEIFEHVSSPLWTKEGLPVCSRCSAKWQRGLGRVARCFPAHPACGQLAPSMKCILNHCSRIINWPWCIISFCLRTSYLQIDWKRLRNNNDA